MQFGTMLERTVKSRRKNEKGSGRLRAKSRATRAHNEPTAVETMVECLQRARSRLWAVWMSLQVEFQGRYSVDRLQQLDQYMKGLSSTRLHFICLLTPLPCLVLGLLDELPPLAPPDAGVYANWVFFARSWAVICFVGGSVLVQMGQSAPRLQLSARQVIFIAALAATVGIGVVFIVSDLTVFPFPFALLVAAPPNVIVIAGCFAYIWGPRWRADPSLWDDIKRQMAVYNCQVALTFIYPLYIFGFLSLSGINQAMFVIVLPIIKLTAKNWISRALTNHNDLKPEAVIFNVEVFNALYVSNALQSASSWTSTAMIMAVDLLHFWLSMLDVMDILNDVKSLMIKIPPNHPAAKENFMQIALKMVTMKDVRPRQNGDTVDMLASSTDSWNEKGADSERRPAPVTANISDHARASHTPSKRVLFHSTQVVPMQTTNNQEYSSDLADTIDFGSIFSPTERELFIQKSTHALFIGEYLILVEYAEVVLPILYSLHRMVLFHLPNSAYYPSLAGLSNDQLLSSIRNVLAYGSLEFASLILSLFLLKRTLGFSSLHQLAFVLEQQAGMVQAKLTIIFVYVMEVSLMHLGADFSFKFAWLQKA